MLLWKPLMPHAIQIRQTGGPEVLNWTPIRSPCARVETAGLGDFASKQIHKRRRAKQADWDGVLGHKMRVENG